MLNDIDLAEIRNRVESGVTRSDLLAYIGKAVNLPKPILALAYMKILKSTDDEIRTYILQALEIMTHLQAGQPEKVNELLASLGLPPEVGKVIMTYARRYNQAD